MKKQTWLLLAFGAGALILLSMKAKPKKRAYTIDVPPPEKITEQEFNQPAQAPGLLQKIAPVVKSVIKKAKERRAARKMGFPDVY